MNIYILTILLVINLFCVNNCFLAQTNDQSNRKIRLERIQPVSVSGKMTYEIQNFVQLKPFERKLRTKENSKQFNWDPVHVSVCDQQLLTKKLGVVERTYRFSLDDGQLEFSNFGEFGGSMKFIPSNSELREIFIFEGRVYSVFELQERIYFIALPPASKLNADELFITDENFVTVPTSYLYELVRLENGFRFEKILNLDTNPRAVTVYEGDILIAGFNRFTHIRNLKKFKVFRNLLWEGHYPNSIAVKNLDEIFVGFRGGFARISLQSEEILYFRNKKR